MGAATRLVARRIVLAFTHGAAPVPALRTAADFARLLSAELHGLLVEDEALFAAAELPFARHLDAAQRLWQPLSTESLARQYAAAAGVLRKHLLEAAAAAGVEGRFAVVRGDPVVAPDSGVGEADLMAVIDGPGSAGGRLAASWGARSASAQAGPALLYVPHAGGPRVGPVLALVTSKGDPSAEVAARIATAAHERLLVVDLSSGRLSPELVGLRPRLAVLQRAAFDRYGALLGELLGGRSLPWLLLDSGEQFL